MFMDCPPFIIDPFIIPLPFIEHDPFMWMPDIILLVLGWLVNITGSA